MLHSRAALASGVTEEQKIAGAACNTEGRAAFALLFRTVLQNSVPFTVFHSDDLYPLERCKNRECLLALTVTNTGLKKRGCT